MILDNVSTTKSIIDEDLDVLVWLFTHG